MRWVRGRTIGRATGSGSGWPRLVELGSATGGICGKSTVSLDWVNGPQIRDTYLARAMNGAKLPDVLFLPVHSKLIHQRLEPRVSHPALFVDLESPSRFPIGDLLSSSSLVSVVDNGGGERWRGCCEDVLETELPREDEHEQGERMWGRRRSFTRRRVNRRRAEVEDVCTIQTPVGQSLAQIDAGTGWQKDDSRSSGSPQTMRFCEGNLARRTMGLA